jgi:hypothetical protein
MLWMKISQILFAQRALISAWISEPRIGRDWNHVDTCFASCAPDSALGQGKK